MALCPGSRVSGKDPATTVEEDGNHTIDSIGITSTTIISSRNSRRGDTMEATTGVAQEADTNITRRALPNTKLKGNRQNRFNSY